MVEKRIAAGLKAQLERADVARSAACIAQIN